MCITLVIVYEYQLWFRNTGLTLQKVLYSPLRHKKTSIKCFYHEGPWYTCSNILSHSNKFCSHSQLRCLSIRVNFCET
jgi:hypothetical protein